ncbi:MAG TPA: FecR domain-containing protein [Burkholderiales bacterium]|nr:FecR domain-containing protein [Burkholderiales bacterium]
MSRLFAVIAAAVLALASGAALASAGYVHDLTGTATATAPNGAPRALKIGDNIESGTTISTGERSSAVIKFEDGQLMVLSGKSSFRIAEYRYIKERPRESSAIFDILAGGLRFITGVIGATDHDSVHVTAGAATIGIRGTDGTVVIDPVTQTVNAAVAAGALAMTTAQGTQNIGAGEFSSARRGERPSPPQPTAQATAAVQQTLNTLAAAQNLPINTPVVVEASARAAAARAAAEELTARAAAQPNNPALQRAAQEATEQAQQALDAAVAAAQQAYQQAIQNGAQPPSPPAPPLPPLPSGATGSTETTPQGSTGTTTPTGGAGAGGGGTSNTASPN